MIFLVILVLMGMRIAQPLGSYVKNCFFYLEKSKEKFLNLEKENIALKEKVIVLENDLKDSKLVLRKFTTGSTILDKILESQKGFYYKASLGYSTSSKPYRIYNKITLVVEESIHVSFNENNENIPISFQNDDKNECEILKHPIKENNQNSQIENGEEEPKDSFVHRENSYVDESRILGDVMQGVRTRSHLRNQCEYVAFLSNLEPKSIDEVIKNYSWIMFMKEELNQFERNKVWTLVPKPKDKQAIGTK